MKRKCLSLLLLTFLSYHAFAQSKYTVKGVVLDTASGKKLMNTSISVLRSKDSTLVKYTRADETGRFLISSLPPGKMFLLVTYPGFADYVEEFRLDSTKSSADFGNIKLILKAKLLADVIIKGKAAAIKIKGDTTEFDAAAYAIQPNSKVEDLLKQLPGIQVDKDGKITAQGQTVSKVLVDGEEFFGDDPTLVTKNIRSDMVDKVQLFDKKSDQAAFTGVDDGKTSKTINLKLKEDKKNGYFGKLDAGAGTDDFYQAQGMFNAFKGKKKFSAYGTLANTGKIGLGWQDNSKFGSSDNVEYGDDGGIYISDDGSDQLSSYNGQYNNQGIPVARTGGTHYDAKWNNDKQSINANYKIGSLNVEGDNNTQNQNNLPTGTIISGTNEHFDNYMFRQKLDGTYTINLDTTTTLKISADGLLKNSEVRSDFATSSIRGNGIRLNETERNITNDVRNKVFNARALLTKKLSKPRRTISVDLRESVTQTEGKGFLKATNEFYNIEGILESDSLTDQYKTSIVKTSALHANVAYTEPLAKYLTIVLNYGFGLNNSTADRRSFNASGNGQYNTLDSLFSNNYDFQQISNQGGAIFNFKKAKNTFDFGTKVASVNFRQKDLFYNSLFKRDFVNWSPQMRYVYKISSQGSLSFNYNGSNVQPTLDQIQPVRVNNDPLNITVGNPDLKPAFRHSIQGNYNSYKVISGTSVYAYANYTITDNPIVSNVSTDSAGRSTFRSVNLSGKNSNSFNFYLSTGQKIKPIDTYVGINANVSRNISYNYVNDELNKLQSVLYSAQLTVSKYKEKKHEGFFYFGPTYTTNESSLQKNINDNGWGFRGYGNIGLVFPLKFEINTTGEYEYRAKTQSFNTDFHRFIWNASFSKKFLKSDGLKLSLSVNDLLNQNVGFSRTASGNMITQSNYTTIKRYFMGSIAWDFNKMGGSATKK
ncbi:TonB-dependent receptor [Pedobacter sp. MC2016-15]|uniref:TonB-dependent receptor n=1 Tax=Pedobacter sp. MC2016-15 TaxID=2994473 RepID=UPI00224616BF|nr:TonB-dependent receptor [Pedobacter sp. MC2016-15]MCX2477592.1 TonB-dependent receptor [Pedobacter sp. MC2016-15]